MRSGRGQNCFQCAELLSGNFASSTVRFHEAERDATLGRYLAPEKDETGLGEWTRAQGHASSLIINFSTGTRTNIRGMRFLHSNSHSWLSSIPMIGCQISCTESENFWNLIIHRQTSMKTKSSAINSESRFVVVGADIHLCVEFLFGYKLGKYENSLAVSLLLARSLIPVRSVHALTVYTYRTVLDTIRELEEKEDAEVRRRVGRMGLQSVRGWWGPEGGLRLDGRAREKARARV